MISGGELEAKIKTQSRGCLCSSHDMLFLLRCHVNTVDKTSSHNGDKQRFACNIFHFDDNLSKKHHVCQ